MTLTLELPPDLEARLNAEAARRGVSPAECALEVLDGTISQAEPTVEDEIRAALDVILTGTWPEGEPRPTTPAEVVAYWERHGLIGTRPEIKDSLEHARALRRKAERQDRT